MEIIDKGMYKGTKNRHLTSLIHQETSYRIKEYPV